MGRGDNGAECLFRQIADIAVVESLDPGKAMPAFEDVHRFAEKQFGIDADGWIGLWPQGDDGLGDHRRFGRDETLGVNLPFQGDISEVGTKGVEAPVKHESLRQPRDRPLAMMVSPNFSR